MRRRAAPWLGSAPGPSGPITLDEFGDPTEATVGIYRYNADNTYSRTN